MATSKRYLKLLDFEVRLTRTIENRRLDSDVGAIRKWFQRRMSTETTTTTSSLDNNNNDSATTSSRIVEQPQHHQQQRRDDEIPVNPRVLQVVLEDYLMDYLKTELINDKTDYATPFQVILYPRTNNRRNRALGSSEYDVDNNKLLEDDGVIDDDDDWHQGFDDDDESGLGRIEMNGIFNSNLESDGTNGGGIEFEEDTLSLLSTTSSLLSHDPTTTTPNQHYLRHQTTNRRTAKNLYSYSKNFGGRVEFEIIDDPSPSNTFVIPSSATVIAYQAQAHAAETDDLLNRLQSTDATDGLTSTTAVTISFASSNNNNGSPQVPTIGPPPNNDNGFDVIIVIAIAVAACSLMLLAFALFLAFRRRKQRRDGQNKEIGSPRNVSTKKSSEGSRSPLNNNAPPVFEVVENDDNISEYTESVYSMPVALGVGDQQQKGVSRGVEMPYGASSRGLEQSFGGGSNRFNPRYVGSEAVEELSRESSEDVNDLDGIPPAHGDGHLFNMLPAVAQDTAEKTTTASVLKDSVLGQLGMDLDHDALIDRDIHSSLEAYGNGDIPDPHGNAHSQDGEHNDALSLSSAETYGFSLDGMNSTVATSTKYGY